MSKKELTPVRCGCGGEAHIGMTESGLFYVECMKCEIETRFYRTESEAVQAWNKAMEERKKGRWIKHENPTLGQCMKILYECSVCHVAVGCEYFVRRSFCPNCGAEMTRGEA